MAVTRAAGVMPLVGALGAAVALAGVAVFSASSAGCDSPGRYVQRDGYIELVGGCIDPQKLPPAPAQQQAPRDQPSSFQQ